MNRNITDEDIEQERGRLNGENIQWFKGLDSLPFPYDGLHLVWSAGSEYSVSGYYIVSLRPKSIEVYSASTLTPVDPRVLSQLLTEPMVRLCQPREGHSKLTLTSLDKHSTLMEIDGVSLELISLCKRLDRCILSKPSRPTIRRV